MPSLACFINNIMKKIIYIENAVKEIDSPEFAHTKQILEVNEVETENGKYKIEKIMEHENQVHIFFKIKDEKYFLCISLDKQSGKVIFPSIQNSNYCYLYASSETKSLEELASYTKIKYTKGYSKGDIIKRANTQKIVKVSSIYFELLETECYETEEAIERLLDKLSEDKQGIKELIKHSNAVIEICKNQYVSANAGIAFSKELLQRLSEFEIGIDVDTYICGKEFMS